MRTSSIHIKHRGSREPNPRHLQVSAIDTGPIMQAIEPVWTEKTETASRVRGRIESVLDWATVRSRRSGENLARWKGHLTICYPANQDSEGQTPHSPPL
ncbi:hypothetical protein D3C85_611870 [compost metagenome]|uniref:phage integrase central domain-containing protein n=1 Tax=Pseudomonas sp. ACN8 TaxID=1920428 RepID=UPI000FB404D0|nr:hypothetical protein BSF44_55870 [Pseudomonas sp. ACN8]